MGRVDLSSAHADVLARSTVEAWLLKPSCKAMEAAAAVRALLPAMSAACVAWLLGFVDAALDARGVEYTPDAWQWTVDAEPWAKLRAHVADEYARRTE